MSHARRTGRLHTEPTSCEFVQTLMGGSCELPGEVMFGGVLLCEGHGGQTQAQEKVDLLQGIVSCLDLYLNNATTRQPPDLARLLRLLRIEQSQAAAQLYRAREDLLSATI